MRRLALRLILGLGLTVLAVAQEHATPNSPKRERGDAGEKHVESAEKESLGLKWANFAILAAALGYLIVKQAGPYFATRSSEIRKGIEDARQISADAEKRAAAMDAKLANLDVEVEALRKSAREEAAMEGDRMRQETQRELAKIHANAEHDVAAALKSAKIELKSYSGQLAIHLARDKVRQRMTAADQDALVSGFVADLGRQEGTTQ